MKVIRSFKQSDKLVHSISFSYNSLNLVSGVYSGLIKLWDIWKQKCLQKFQSGMDINKTISYFPEHNSIIGSCSYDGKIRIHDLRCRKKICKYDFGYFLESFKFFPNQRIIVGKGRNFIKFWDMWKNSPLFVLSKKSSLLNISSPSTKSKIYATSGKCVRYIRTADFKFFTIGQYRKRISAIEFINKGFLAGFESGKILLRSKKIPAFHFFKIKPLIKWFITKKKLSNSSGVNINDFLSPLNNFYQKNLKLKKKLIFKNFKHTNSYKKEQIYSPLTAVVRIENKNFWKIDFFYFISQFILTLKFCFSKELITKYFFILKKKKIYIKWY